MKILVTSGGEHGQILVTSIGAKGVPPKPFPELLRENLGHFGAIHGFEEGWVNLRERNYKMLFLRRGPTDEDGFVRDVYSICREQ